MGLNYGDPITALDINSLKARVKTEMQRRVWGTRPLKAYGDSSWDFFPGALNPNTVEVGTPITKDEIDKILTPLNQIATQTDEYGQPYTVDNVTAKALINMSNNLTTYATQGQLSASSCNANCSGLCSSCTGTCTGSCTGCSGCTSCTSCSGCSGCGGCGGCSGCGGCGSFCSGGCMGCGGSGHNTAGPGVQDLTKG